LFILINTKEMKLFQITMNLEPQVNNSIDENNYGDYDDRPIRPMDQDALNEALARLPILVDESEPNHQTDPTAK